MQYIKKREKSKTGFTLLEMLLVAGILSVISLALYSTFSNGIRIWDRVNKPIPEEDLGIIFDRFTLDLKNTAVFATIGFTGGENRLSFATLVESPVLEKRTIGSVVYLYDAQTERLERWVKDFTEIYSERKGVAGGFLANVTALRFVYYYYDTEKKEYIWLDEWSREGVPLAVRMELEIDYGYQKEAFTRTVGIPVNS